MDNEFEQRIATAEAIAFVGETLAPFYLNDPRTGDASAVFSAMAALNPQDAASEWPFAAREEALCAFSLMAEGLAGCTGVSPCTGQKAFMADDALVDEYRRLFIGPAPKPAPPWGSVYTDRECVVFGESTIALRAWMRDNGIARLSDERTPEDHIGLMLALMAHVARMHTGLLDEYLRLHLLTWAPHFLHEFAEAAEHPFYRGLAMLTDSSLEGIREALSVDVVEPRFYR